MAAIPVITTTTNQHNRDQHVMISPPPPTTNGTSNRRGTSNPGVPVRLPPVSNQSTVGQPRQQQLSYNIIV